MAIVEITRNENKLYVKSPYHPDLPGPAKKLGGKWDKTRWSYDLRDENRVKDLYKSIYGTCGEDDFATDLVDIRVTFLEERSALHGGVFVAGRCVARAKGRDGGAPLGDGVILLAGNIISGGSVKNWRTIVRDGTVVEIRDVPRAAIENELDSNEIKIEIISDDVVCFDALRLERARLAARIDEIDKILDKN